MKIRIKFTNTQKFILEVSGSTFGCLKTSVLNYINNTYGKELTSIALSFNGKEPILSEDDDLLSSIGIVNGDLLTVLPSSEDKPLNSVSLIEMEKPQNPNREVTRDVIPTDPGKVSNLLEARDGVPPPSCINAFDIYNPLTQSEAINILVHLTMIEAGFVLGEDASDLSNTLPASWKDIATTLKYSHPGFQNFITSVVLVTMGGIKQVLASFPGQDSEISVRLEMKEYFSSSKIETSSLVKLSHFTRKLRNELLYPLQVAAHLRLGVPAPWHLCGLPQEITIKIASLLNLRSVLNLSATCKSLQRSMVDNKLWYNLFKKDFRDQYHSSDTISGADWRRKYRAAYERKKERKNLENDIRFVLDEDFPNHGYPRPNPAPRNPYNPYIPNPRGPGPYYPPQPDPQPNPFWDPDSPYFGGEIPPPRAPFNSDPFNPLGGGGRGPNNPFSPFQPPFMPPRPRNPRGPRFDYI